MRTLAMFVKSKQLGYSIDPPDPLALSLSL
jgi:hypothetical protein